MPPKLTFPVSVTTGTPELLLEFFSSTDPKDALTLFTTFHSLDPAK